MKERIIWNVPEGFKIDKGQSNERQIVLNKVDDEKVRSWEEYCKKMKGKDSCFVDMNGNIRTTNFSSTAAVGEFEDKEDAVAFAALYKLISFRRDWVGKWEPNWNDVNENKFSIDLWRDGFQRTDNPLSNHSMSFQTKEMCDEFFNTFQDLLEIAKPLL